MVERPRRKARPEDQYKAGPEGQEPASAPQDKQEQERATNKAARADVRCQGGLD